MGESVQEDEDGEVVHRLEKKSQAEIEMETNNLLVLPEKPFEDRGGFS
jgi:hypothetical protein